MFNIIKYTLEHEGGTKDYDMWIVTNAANNRALLIRRWGRIGTDGQINVKDFSHHNQARAYAQKILDDKTKPSHGYDGNIVLDERDRDLEFVRRSIKPSVFMGVPSTKWAWIGVTEAMLHGDEGISTVAPPVADPTPTVKIESPAHYGSW